MFSRAFSGLGKLLPLLLIFVMVLVYSGNAEAAGALYGAVRDVLVMSFFALCAHRVLLLGATWREPLSTGPGSDQPKAKVLSFMLRSLFFMVVLLACAFPVFRAVIWLENQVQLDAGQAEMVAMAFFAVIVAVNGVLLASIGTVFPAAAVGGIPFTSRALQRGRITFFRTLLRLAIGGAPVYGLASLLDRVTGWYLADAAGSYMVVQLTIDAAFAVLKLLSVYMAVVALSMAYEEGEARLAEKEKAAG